MIDLRIGKGKWPVKQRVWSLEYRAWSKIEKFEDISEGFSRQIDRESIQFLYVSKGSALDSRLLTW